MEENTQIVEISEESVPDLTQTASSDPVDAASSEMVAAVAGDSVETVSGGDIVGNTGANVNSSAILYSAESLTVDDIIQAIETAEINAVVEVNDENTIWTKPLEEYTVSEGLLLILVLCVVGYLIQKIIGGVLTCTSLLKK